MAEACGSQQVRLTRQNETRIRRAIDQLREGLVRVEDAAGTGTCTVNADWIDISAGSVTETISVPTRTGQILQRTIDKADTVTPKIYKAKFGTADNLQGSALLTAASTMSASATGAHFQLLSGKYKGGWSWYLMSKFNFDSTP